MVFAQLQPPMSSRMLGVWAEAILRVAIGSTDGKESSEAIAVLQKNQLLPRPLWYCLRPAELPMNMVCAFNELRSQRLLHLRPPHLLQ